MRVTARLEGWSWDPVFNIIWGYIYDDIHERWPDGTRIHTSSIDKKYRNKVKEGDIAPTLNSFYKLGEPFSEEYIRELTRKALIEEENKQENI